MIRPPRLRPGDRVAVIAPAGPVPRDGFDAGASIIRSRYQPVYGERIFARSGYLAGEDAARLGELRVALSDPSLRAIFCARGGYGIMRLLPAVEPELLRGDPKPIVGFSDVTALHAWAMKTGVVSVHGPVVTQLGALPREASALFALLESDKPPPRWSDLRVIAGGTTEGRLIGGNLEMVTRLIGTPWAFDLDGAVLLIEDVGERPYRVDRQLTHLKLAGFLDGIVGVVVGDFVRCLEPDGSGPTVDEVLVEQLSALGVPVLAGAPIGHGDRNVSVPHGGRVRLDSDARTLTFLEAAVS